MTLCGILLLVCFPGGSVVKNLLASAGDTGLIPGLGRSPEEGSGNPLQCSCLENPMDKGAWWATVHGVAKRVRHYWTTECACTSPLKRQPSLAFSWRRCLRWGLRSFWQVNSVFLGLSHLYILLIFVWFPPVNLFHVNLILRPVRRTWNGKENFSSLTTSKHMMD